MKRLGILLATGLLAFAAAASAQNYPTKPIRIFVSSFGSGPDATSAFLRTTSTIEH